MAHRRPGTLSILGEPKNKCNLELQNAQGPSVREMEFGILRPGMHTAEPGQAVAFPYVQ